MKILVLGGGGKQGSRAAAMLSRKPEISEIVLVDEHEGPLRPAAESVGTKARTVAMDVSDLDGVAALLRETPKPTVVLNTVGPGFQFAEPLGRLAIDAQVDYVDLQDDADAVSRVAALHEAATDAGITMISGVGLTPGLSNILCKRAVQRFDAIEEVQIYWVANMTTEPTIANWGHRLGLWTQDVPIVQGGKLTFVPGGTEKVVINWPEPAGAVIERLCAHPEPLTLHDRFPNIERISVRGGYTPQSHDEFVANLRELGLTSRAPVQIAGASVSAVEFISVLATTPEFRGTDRFKSILDAEALIGDNNGLRVEVTGVLDGKPTTEASMFFSRDRNIGIYMTAAVVTYLVAKGEITDRGLLFAEDLDPDLVLSALRQEGVEIHDV